MVFTKFYDFFQNFQKQGLDKAQYLKNYKRQETQIFSVDCQLIGATMLSISCA